MNIPRLALLLFVTLFISSCSLFRGIVDYFSPPISSVDQQFISTKENLSQSSNFIPHVAVFFSDSELIPALNEALIEAIKDVDTKTLEFKKLDVNFKLVTQGVWLEIEFDVLEKNSTVQAKGALNGVAALEINGEKLVVRPALSSIKIDSLKRSKGTTVLDGAASVAIRSALRNFADNVNGKVAASPYILDTRAKEYLKYDLNDLFSGTDVQVKADRMKGSITFKGGLIKITSKGLYIMLSLEPSYGEDEVEKEIVSTELSLHKNLRDLNQIFDKYEKKFDDLWRESFDVELTSSKLGLGISKIYLSSTVNTVLSQQIEISGSFDLPESPFSSKVEAEKSKINCQNVRVQFKKRRYKRDSCNWDCQECVDPCRPLGRCRVCTDDPVCKANRASCNVIEEAKVAADNIEWNLQKAKHDTEMELKVAECNVVREANNFLALGKFSGKGKVSGTANLKLKDSYLSTSLDELKLNLIAGSKVNLNANLNIMPYDLGNVFLCFSPFSKNIESNGNVKIPYSENSIKVSHTYDNKALVLQAKIPAIHINANVSPSPIETFLTDPAFLTKCLPAANIMFAGAGIGASLDILGIDAPKVIDMLMGRIEHTQEFKPFTIRIEPFEVRISKQKAIIPKVLWGKKSINVVY